MVRPLHRNEIADLLAADTVARLSTIDSDGYPHVTPIWFLWADGVFHLTSYVGRPHLERIRSNTRVGLLIDVEDELRADGERPNRQIRVIGDAAVRTDAGAYWTKRIWAKYTDPAVAVERNVNRERVLITVLPRRTIAVASV